MSPVTRATQAIGCPARQTFAVAQATLLLVRVVARLAQSDPDGLDALL